MPTQLPDMTATGQREMLIRAFAAWFLLGITAALGTQQAMILVQVAMPTEALAGGGIASYPVLSGYHGGLMVAAPLLAVLVAAKAGPRVRTATAVTLVALAMYATMLLCYGWFLVAVTFGHLDVFMSPPGLGAAYLVPRLAVELLTLGLLLLATGYVEAQRARKEAGAQ